MKNLKTLENGVEVSKSYLEMRDSKNKRIQKFLAETRGFNCIQRFETQRALTLDTALQALRFAGGKNGNDTYISACKLYKCNYYGTEKETGKKYVVRYCNADSVEFSGEYRKEVIFFEMFVDDNGTLVLNTDKGEKKSVAAIEWLLSIKEVLIEGYYKDNEYKDFNDSTVDEVEKIVNGTKIYR